MNLFRQLKNSTLSALAFAGFVMCSISPLYAVPAHPGLISYDSGGKTLQVYLRGDEHSHYFVSPDGFMLLRGDDDIFRYALPMGDKIVASSIVASPLGERSADEEALLASFQKQAPFDIMNRKLSLRKSLSKSPARVADESLLCSFPTTGSPRCLAILVEFQDVEFTLPDPHSLFDRMLNEEGFSEYGATGSIHDFFNASSGGNFTPQFDVYGPVKLPYNMSYYGSNDPNTGNDVRPYEMIPHAVDLLKDQIDFSIYDTDDDGIVDNIYIFYAGYGEADGGPANSIWPHSWNIHDDLGLEIYMNGKLLNHYATSNELCDGRGSNLAGIGVFCHEFSHVMGLPDLYSTIYSSAFTPGNWSIMDHGSYNNESHTPPCHTGYERYHLGWIEPKVLADPKNVTIYPISQIGAYNDVYMIPTPNRSEYYILENRQQSAWDQYIPGHGLLVWHINFDPEKWLLNVVNIDKQYIDIVEADNDLSEYSRAGDTFPGTAGVTEFTDDSTPSMRTWSGQNLYSPITDIKDIDGVVSFAFKGGENIFDEMVALDPTDIKAGGFTARWNPISRTTGYLLSVFSKESHGDLTERNYVEGYLKREVDNTDSFQVTGLEPSTTYYYTVTATNGRFYSPESNEIEVTTLDPTLDYKRVNLLPASEITETSFRANWQMLDDADRYEVSLYHLGIGDPFLSTADFTDHTLPSGWQTDASFDGRASFAVAVPSLRMTTDGASLTTASFDAGVRTLSFWYRASSTLRDGRIEISGYSDGEWKVFHTISDLVSAAGGSTVSISEIPALTTRIKIALRTEAGGSLSIDDVTIGYGGNVDYIPVEGQTAIDAGNSDSFLFSNLTPDMDYGYSVVALNQDFRSLDSGILPVSTSPASLQNVADDHLRISLSGLALSIFCGHDTDVTISDIAGPVVAARCGRMINILLPHPGVYLVSAEGKIFKIIAI